MKISQIITALATMLGATAGSVEANNVYIEQNVNTNSADTTRVHLDNKQLQFSHTAGATPIDKVATKQPFHLGLLEGTLAAYGERTAKTSGIGFDLIGKLGQTATVGATYENNGEKVVDLRCGVDNTFTTQVGVARVANNTLYHAICGCDPTTNARVSISALVNEDGRGRLNYGMSTLQTIRGQKVGGWVWGTQDEHGNGFTDVLVALDPTFGYKAGHYPLTLDDKGFADVSRVDNIADFRAPFNSQRGSTVLRVRDYHGSTGSKHTAEVDCTKKFENGSATIGAALGWKNSDTSKGTVTTVLGATYHGWSAQLLTDHKPHQEPTHQLWLWKEWRF